LTSIVRLCGSGGRELAVSLCVWITHHPDHRVWHRLAVVVEYAAGNRAAAREPQLEVAQMLSGAKLPRRSRLQRTPLSV
jgi:hypothetical protein